MASDEKLNQSVRFSEEQAQQIIGRALSLHETRRETVSAADIRGVLEELGVSPDVVEAAIHDAAARPSQASTGEVAEAGTLGVALGALAAAGAPFASDPLIVVPAMLGFGLMFAGLLTTRPGTGIASAFRRYQHANLVLWGGMGAGYIAVTLFSGYSLAMSAWTFPFAWAFTSVSGAVLMRYKGDGGSTVERSVVVRIAKNAVRRLKDILKPWTESVIARPATDTPHTGNP